MSNINHFGVSGGKDSTAQLLWAVHESGYPIDTIRATFCDTGNEAQETYDYIQMLSKRVCPIERIAGPLDFYELAVKKGRFPSARARFCTQSLKMEPTKVWIDARLAEGHTVLNHAGVRASESAERAKLEDREPAWVSYFGVETFRPLLRWTLADVWATHERYGIPRNPLYGMGCQRVGCLPCVMSRKAEIATIARKFPARVDRIRECETEALGNRRGGSTFFPPTMVPVRYRTGNVYENKHGQGIKLTMIDDVVRWATEGTSAITGNLNFDDLDEPPTCDSRSGLCE